MAIEELLALVPPPPRSQLIETEEVFPWAEIQGALGTALPSDYRDFGQHYGSGCFEDGTFDFWILNPLAEAYLEHLEDRCKVWRLRREAFTHEFPADIFPIRSGLLPWGRDIDGGMMGWLMVGGDPEKWPVVTKQRDDDSFEQFNMHFTTFLAKALKHELRPHIWRPDYPEDLRQLVFRPREQN
jgi:hypothetical protein